MNINGFFGHLAIPIAIGLVSAAIGFRTGLPGATLILPIFTVAAWTVISGQPAKPAPPWLQLVAFGVLGAMIGMSIDRDSLGALRANWPILLAMAVAVYAGATLIALVLARFSHVDIATALLAGSPGGLTGVSAVSLSAGANVAQVAAVQTLRVLLIYASLPFLLTLLKQVK